MEIERTPLIYLTAAQWRALKGIVLQGKMAERALGLPLEITNGDQKIEITEEETTITLE